MACPHAPKNLLSRLWIAITHSAFIVGLLSLIWLIARTGTKPSRVAYPCQRTAAANGAAWLAAYVIPLLPFARTLRGERIGRRVASRGLGFVILAMGVLCLGSGLEPAASRGAHTVLALTLSEQRATNTLLSSVFAVQGIKSSTSGMGIPELISLMYAHDTCFYRSGEAGVAKGPNGLFAADDVVLIKVNCQWDQRGGTNTDLLRAVIQALLSHPDGFTGEVIVADNGQAQFGPRRNGGSLDWARNNAETLSQSAQEVVDAFSETARVSTYLWDEITLNEVAEYSRGDSEDGYVVEAEEASRSRMPITYPKFTTLYDTHVSFKHGIWDPEAQTYNSHRLKVINLPVLKPHMIYGVTGAVKHYMGVVSDWLSSMSGMRAHNAIPLGAMGFEMVETRFPTLNVLDALYVSFRPGDGPMVYYAAATQIGIIAASTDPVALDAWAARHILMQGAEQAGYATSSFNPSTSESPKGSFAHYLEESRQVLHEQGFRVTSDERAMHVFVRAL